MTEDGNDNNIIIFATDENIKLLAEAETIYVDGTFRTCPSSSTKSSLYTRSRMGNNISWLTVCFQTKPEHHIRELLIS